MNTVLPSVAAAIAWCVVHGDDGPCEQLLALMNVDDFAPHELVVGA
jgi:hypothetical protein